jgi:dihydrofolate reductase
MSFPRPPRQSQAPALEEGKPLMGRLIVSAQMTMDSVMDQLEGWFDEKGDVEEHGLEEIRAADAVLLGRETYEQLSRFWPSAAGPYAELINAMPKYVTSRTLTEPLTWNAELLGPDTVEEVRRLKTEYAGSVISYGCGELANVLARKGLGDAVHLRRREVEWRADRSRRGRWRLRTRPLSPLARPR